MDTFELLRVHSIANLVNHALGSYKVGELSYHKPGAARSYSFNRYLGASLDSALTLAVCLK